MPFVVTLGIVGLCTVTALVRPRRLRRPAYFLAVVVNEIPHVVALYLVLAVLLARSEGELDGVGGPELLVLVGMTLMGQLVLARRGLAAAGAVRGGLARAGIARPSDAATRPGRLARWLGPLLAPFPIRPWRVRRVRGLAYGDHRRQRVDVYTLRRRQAVGPVFLYLHGGGYFSGGRHREGRALLHHLASRGWVCVSAGYRLRPGADFEDHLSDARAALAWAHTHAHEHGGDDRTLVMAGSSAGAHLAALCALTQDDEPDPVSSRVDAAVGLYGYYGRYYGRGPDETPVSSPLDLDPSAAPPFLLAHGDHDSYVPVELARNFARHLRSRSPREVVYAELPGAQHGFDLFRSWRVTAVIQGVDAFLAAVLPPVVARRTAREDAAVHR